MIIEDILLALTSFPVGTEARTIETAVALAANLTAKVSAIAFEMDIQSPIGLYADPLGVSAILAADSTRSAANARDLLSIFERIAIGGNARTIIVCCAPNQSRFLTVWLMRRGLEI